MTSYKSFINKLIKVIRHCPKTVFGLINTFLNFTRLKTKSSSTLAVVLFLVTILYTLPAAIYARDLKIGVYQTPPVLYFDSDGQPGGLYVDVLNEIAERENWDIEYVAGNWPNLLEKAKKGDIDILCTIAKTEERSKYLNFSREFVVINWGSVYVAQGSSIENYTDLEGKVVALLEGDVYNEEFRELIKAFNVGIDIIEVESFEDVFRKIDQNIAEAGVVNRFFGHDKSDKYKVEETSMLFAPLEIRYGFSKDIPPSIISAVDRHLKDMRNNPDSIYNQKLNQAVDKIPVYHLPDWAKLSLIVAGVLIILFFIRQAVLKFKINIKIRELEREYLDRREIAGRLSKAESKFNQFFHSLPIPAFIIDSNGYFKEINTAFIRGTGFKQDDVVGKSIFGPLDMFDSSSKDKIMDKFRRRVNKEEVSPYTVQIKTADGHEKQLKVTAIAIFKNNKVVEVIGTAIEVPVK